MDKGTSASRAASSSPSRSGADSSPVESPAPTSAVEAVDSPSSSPPAPKPGAAEQKEEEVPLPAFLRQTRAEIHITFQDLEWLQRERLSKGLAAGQSAQPPSSDHAQWTRVSGEDVTKRNRYINVDPFLHNRVRLKVPEGHSDYINASPIRLAISVNGEEGGQQEKYFIATQGPKQEHQSHIWRMLWHETSHTSPAIIVMLTQTHESGREKCYPYFPSSLSAPTLAINEVDEFDDDFLASLTLRSVAWDEEIRSTVREMVLATAGGEEKVVRHFLFAGWPDFLVPEGRDRDALVELVRRTAGMNADPASPRIVHCSAGVGRSGTFIALDWLLSELEAGAFDDLPTTAIVNGECGERGMENGETEVRGVVVDPIAEVVDRLRRQRVMMVQGEAQFMFLYDVLREKWVERWKKMNATAGEKQEEDGEMAEEKAEQVVEKEDKATL